MLAPLGPLRAAIYVFADYRYGHPFRGANDRARQSKWPGVVLGIVPWEIVERCQVRFEASAVVMTRSSCNPHGKTIRVGC